MLVGLALGLLALVGCSAPSAAATTQTARGVLLAVESPGIDRVDRFTLRTDEGQEMVFVADPNFNKNKNQGGSGVMTPGHMRQHMALADPVVVTYRDENGTLVALSAADVS